jgi:hypothetical protein
MILLSLFAGPAAAMMPIEPDGMQASVKQLSSKELRGRGLGTKELDRAAALIARRFEEAGLLPGGAENGSWYQQWHDPDLKMQMRNVVGILPGRNPLYAGQSLVIGAHYDHLGMGMSGALKENQGAVHPGADDNASGVAVLLELASRLVLVPNMERSIVFVAFTGEEAGRKGSQHFVRTEKRYPVSRAVGMINLDTVGRLGKGKLIVLGAGSAKEWAELFRELGNTAKVGIAASDDPLDSSDHISFHEAGVPAVQLFTGAHLDYHRPTDTADKIDGKGLAKIATIVRELAFYLANHPAPLTTTVTPSRPQPAHAPRGARTTTIGIVPDFTYNEKGVRLGGAVPGGPAEQGGMTQGDIIVRVGQTPIDGLKDLSDVIRASSPGDRLTVIFRRGEKEYQTTVEVRER